MRAGEQQHFTNLSATPAAFQLKGGLYGIDVSATFGGGSVILKKLAADLTTYVPCENINGVATGFTAAGYQVFLLPPGTYELVIATATAVYAQIQRIPGE